MKFIFSLIMMIALSLVLATASPPTRAAGSRAVPEKVTVLPVPAVLPARIVLRATEVAKEPRPPESVTGSVFNLRPAEPVFAALAPKPEIVLLN